MPAETEYTLRINGVETNIWTPTGQVIHRLNGYLIKDPSQRSRFILSNGDTLITSDNYIFCVKEA